MDLEIVEAHPKRVLAAFREGRFDQIEILGQADEKEFFELCFQKKLLESLAESMPTARKKEEVSRWFILAANLSLELHGENSYLGFERVVRCGGLLQTLDPAIAAKHLDPQSQRWFIHCRGFNDGPAISRCKTEHQVEVVIPIKKNMDLWTDAWALAAQGQWELLSEPLRWSSSFWPIRCGSGNSGRPTDIVGWAQSRTTATTAGHPRPMPQGSVLLSP